LKNLFHPIFDLLAATLTTFHGWGALWWLSIAMLAARRDHETARRARGRPLGGFLPALVQLPIFMAYYFTIQRFEALDSFRTGGLFWFQDLTVADPYLILPVAYILTVMDAQEIAIRGATPQQKNLCASCPWSSACSASPPTSSSTGLPPTSSRSSRT
jgi:YidC/Oxa1 family membrane protein insertase